MPDKTPLPAILASLFPEGHDVAVRDGLITGHGALGTERLVVIGVDGDNNAVTDVIKDTVPRNIQYDRVRSNCHHVLMTWTGRSYSTLSRFSRRMPMQSQQLVTSLRQESRKDNEALSTPSLG